MGKRVVRTKVLMYRALSIFFITSTILYFYSSRTQQAQAVKTFIYHSPPQLFDPITFSSPTTNNTPTVLPALKQLCSRTVWRKDTYLNCYFLTMGALNLVNKIQTCVRWALDAGMGMITPKIWVRDPISLYVYDGTLGRDDLDVLFDTEFFYETLKINCPQFKFIDLDNLPTKNRSTILSHYGLLQVPPYGPGEYNKHISELVGDRSPSHFSPIVIDQDESYFGFRVLEDPIPLQSDFRSLFRFLPILYQIANRIIDHLPSNNEYIGVHLRAEGDWMHSSHAENITSMILSRHLVKWPVVYVACGEPSKQVEFTNLLAKGGIKTTYKWKLASEEETKILKTLNFDQLGVVDYLVLHSSKYFYGTPMSSFSYALAVGRHFEQFHNLAFNIDENDDQQILIGYLQPVFLDACW